jgi:glycosyltransferase involved in cell wall biosynthesis
MKLSLVIPVYNIEEYIPICIDSILNQKYEDYELLLINDGSTDQSGNICDNYALKDKRIHVFHQKNAGVSAARNLGLEQARGKWICFIDGDDELHINSLSAIMAETNNSKAEVIIARSYTTDGKTLKKEKYGFDKSFLNRNFNGYELLADKSYKRGSVCGCVFNHDFLKTNQIRFPLGLKIGEDSIFFSLVYLHARYFSFIDQIFYLIKEREGSATRCWDYEKVSNMTNNISFINKYIKDHPNLNKKQIYILHYAIYGAVSSIFNQLIYCFSIKNYFTTLKKVRKELDGKIDTGNIPVNKNKIKLLNFSLNCYSMNVLINRKIRNLIQL